MLSLFRNRAYLVFWLGQAVSSMGDMIIFVALPVWVFQLTGSKAALGLSFTAGVLPRLLLAPVAGVLVDRWDRRRTMLISDVLRSAGLVGLFFVGGPGDVWLIYAVNFLNACVSRFYFPAKNALIPHLVGPDRLVQANSLSSVSDSAAQMVGPLMGAALIATGGPNLAVTVDLASFGVSIATLVLLGRLLSSTMDAPQVQAAGSVSGVLQGLADGVRLAWRTPVIRFLLLTACLAGLAQGSLLTLLLPFLTEVLGLSEDYFGWAVAADGAGALLGGLAVGLVAARLRPEVLFASGLTVAGLVIALMVKVRLFPLLVGGMVIEGAVGAGVMIATMTILQTRVSDHYRGRLASLWSMTSSIAMVGMMSAGFLADIFGTAEVLMGAAGLAALGGVFAFATMVRVSARPVPAPPSVGEERSAGEPAADSGLAP